MLTTEDNIDDDIRAALHMGDVEPQADAVIPEPVAQDSAETKEDARQRDESGKFAKKTDEPIAKPEETAQVTEVVASPEPTEVIRPPQSWSAEAKSKFAALDPAIQTEVAKRERELDVGFSRQANRAKDIDGFEAALAPVADRLTLSGMGKAEYVTALVRADEMLRNPQTRDAAFAHLGQMYGVQSNGGPPQQADPQYQQYQALQQQVQTLSQALEAQKQEREQSAQSELQGQIATFASKPENLYFENVKETMAALLQSGKADTLEKAYDMACYADQDIRALLTKPATVQAPQTPAKPKDISVKGSPGMVSKTTSTTPGADIEDDIRSALREHAGRV